MSEQEEKHWLVEKAKQSAIGAIRQGPEAIAELSELLQSFSKRQKAKILARMKSEGN